MYSLNASKNQYMQMSEDLEVYKIITTLPIDYQNNDLNFDKEKDFDHLHQLITMYGKILFFSKPRRSMYKGKKVYEVDYFLHPDRVRCEERVLEFVAGKTLKTLSEEKQLNEEV